MVFYYQAAGWSTVKLGLAIQDLLIEMATGRSLSSCVQVGFIVRIDCFLSISNNHVFANSSFPKLVLQFIEDTLAIIVAFFHNQFCQRLPIKNALIN